MDKLARTEKLTAQVSLALAAGMVSIMPVTYGAPVLDRVVEGGAVVKPNGTTTVITSNEQNNIINWKDFSINQGEKVQFDGGQKQHNYLNLVTGDQVSRINGTLEGGQDVYIVNPKGVVFSKEAKVDVGNLYVSTTKNDLDTTQYLAKGDSPLVNTASAAAADVVNMGQINADKVYVEGGTIKFFDTDKVNTSADAVQLYANTAVDLGHNATADTKTYKTNKDATNYINVTKDIIINGLGSTTGNYWLTDDIDLSGTTIKPIADSFSGIFDGNFYTISNFAVSNTNNAGLFGSVSGTVQHLGVSGATITGKVAGGITGNLTGNGKVTQSFVKSSTITSTRTGAPKANQGSGGIAGVIAGGTVSESYVSGTSADGGIAGYLNGGDINNVYTLNSGGTDKGKLVDGIFCYGSGGTGSKLSYAYTNATSVSEMTGGSDPTVLTGNTSTESAYYKNLGFKISNIGGESTIWRIYEGKSLPLLRCFLTANGTVTVNYNYTQGDVTGSNNGQDLTTTYNMQQVKLDGTPTYSSEIDTGRITALSDSDDYKNVVWDATNNTAKLQAAFYTGQDGYDLVGNNITIEPRDLVISSSGLGTDPINKQYDGTATVDKATLASRFDAKSGSAKGLIAGDTTVTIDTSGLSGFYSKDGTNKYAKADSNPLSIVLSGGITASNVGSYHNYNITNANDFNGVKLKGNITPKHLKIVAGTGFAVEKTYNGKDNTSVDDDDTLAKQISGGYLTLDGVINKYNDDGSQSNTAEDVTLQASTDSKGTYYDADGNATGKASQRYRI